MLCYSCESQKENSDCQINPNQTTSIMCETKQQLCYSKKTTNAGGEEQAARARASLSLSLPVCHFAGKLLQFSRGCSMPPSSTGNITQQAQCLTSKTEGKTICVKYCQASLCNIQDIRFVARRDDHALTSSSPFLRSDGALAATVTRITHVVYYLLALLTIVLSTHHHYY